VNSNYNKSYVAAYQDVIHLDNDLKNALPGHARKALAKTEARIIANAPRELLQMAIMYNKECGELAQLPEPVFDNTDCFAEDADGNQPEYRKAPPTVHDNTVAGYDSSFGNARVLICSMTSAAEATIAEVAPVSNSSPYSTDNTGRGAHVLSATTSATATTAAPAPIATAAAADTLSEAGSAAASAATGWEESGLGPLDSTITADLASDADASPSAAVPSTLGGTSSSAMARGVVAVCQLGATAVLLVLAAAMAPGAIGL
jgi:hypothetical protein